MWAEGTPASGSGLRYPQISLGRTMAHQTPVQLLRSGGHRIKHFLYDYSILLSFFIVLVMIIPCVIFEDARTKEYLLGVIGIGGGLSYFLLTHHTEEVKLFQELFTAFNERYDKMNGRLNAIISAPVQTDFFSKRTQFPLRLLQPLRRRIPLLLEGLCLPGSLGGVAERDADFLQKRTNQDAVERRTENRLILRTLRHDSARG